LGRARAVDRHDAAGRPLPWAWDESQIHVKLQGSPVGSLQELGRSLRRARALDPQIKVRLDAAAGTLSIDAIKVVDECVLAGVVDLTLAGAPRSARS